MCMADSKAAFKISALPNNCSHGHPYETVYLADIIPHCDKTRIDAMNTTLHSGF